MESQKLISDYNSFELPKTRKQRFVINTGNAQTPNSKGSIWLSVPIIVPTIKAGKTKDIVIIPTTVIDTKNITKEILFFCMLYMNTKKLNLLFIYLKKHLLKN